jgi:transposase
MIQLTSNMRILVATAPVDMRKQIDGLCAICRDAFGVDPLSGVVFAFTGRNRKMVRLLAYDNQGFWLCTKRLSVGRFPHWPVGAAVTSLEAHEVMVLLRGGDPSAIATLVPWRKIV